MITVDAARIPQEAELDHLRAMHEIRAFEDESHRCSPRAWSAAARTSARARRRWRSALPRAPRRRHDDLHLPRPRRRARDGRAARPGVRRDPGQGRRALPRQGRLDAPHRRERRRARLVRDRRRPPPDRDRARRSPPRYRGTDDGHALLLRRRGRRTSAPSTRRSTWPRSGSCRSSSCARTTSTASTRRSRRPPRSSASPIAPTATRWPERRIDGNDVLARARRRSAEAVERARAGGGPTLIEALTYRHKGHSRSDPATYRPAGRARARGSSATRSSLLERRSRDRGRPTPSGLDGRARRPQPRWPSALERAQRVAGPGPLELALRGRLRMEREPSTYKEADHARRIGRRAGGRRGRVPDRRGHRRRRRCLQDDGGALRPLRRRAACWTRRSPSRRSSGLRDRGGDRAACDRSPRSCSPTSPASASTRSRTSCRRTGT